MAEQYSHQGYHRIKIKKGKFGELSKIREELEEAEDAEYQKQDIMLLIELSDMIGAIRGVADKYGMSIDQLSAFSKLRSKVAKQEYIEKEIKKVFAKAPQSQKIYALDEKFSKLEKYFFDEFSKLLDRKGFTYLSIPSTIALSTILRQEMVPHWVSVDNNLCLGGSAEQGILERFAGEKVNEKHLYAVNQCYRREEKYESPLRLLEFKKIEQFCFCKKENWETNFDLVLQNAVEFLKRFAIPYRIVDVTKRDAGYHIKKVDIEVKTKKWGWVETHSCTYFGTEQSKRFDITGANHTISSTGIASPRILLPFIDGSVKIPKTFS